MFKSPVSALLLIALALFSSVNAAALPDTLTLFYPPDGSFAGSELKNVSSYGYSESAMQSGIFDRNVSFAITYPNGTTSSGGSVASGTCPARGGGSARYTFYFPNNQTGLYRLLVTLRYGLPEPKGNCSSPFTYQESTTELNFTLVEPSDSGQGVPQPLTTTASLLPKPTGSFQVSSAATFKFGAGLGGALLGVVGVGVLL